jgi:hypothetical protein
MKKNLQIGKKIALALILLVTATVTNAQTRTASVTGNWNATATWGGASVPTSANDVVINAGVTVTVNVAAAANSITYNGGATANVITISGTNSLAVTGAITMNGTTAVTGNQATLLTIGSGSVSCASLAINPIAGNLGSNNRRTEVTISTGSLSVTGNISASGNVTGGSGITLSGAGSVNVGGALYTSPNFGVFTPGTASTITYSGAAAQSVLAEAYGTLVLSGSGNKTLAGATTVATGLTLTGGTLVAGTNLTLSANSLITRSEGTMTGTLQGTAAYDLTYTGNSKTSGPESSNGGLRTVNANLTAGQTLTLDANKSPDGNLTVTAGTLDLSTFTINRSAAGGTLTVSNGATLKIGGTNAFPTNYNTHSVGATSTVEYAGTAQSVTTLNSTQSYGNLILSGSGLKTFTGETVVGTLSLRGTATTTGTTVYGAAGTLAYEGSATQTTGSEFPAASGPANLTINNSSNVTLNAARTITGALTLTSGDLGTNNTNLLTISATGSTSGGSASSHVNGPLSKTGSANFTFPVGNGTLYRPISLSALSASATVRATYFLANPRTAFGTTGTGTLQTIKDVSLCEYWDLDDGAATITGIVGLQYSSTSPCNGGGYIGDPSALVVAHWNTTTLTWENKGAAIGATGTNMTAATSSSFSPFTIGTTDAGLNGLPVSFTDVKAFEKGAGVQVEWTNATESDMSTYVIERSANGIDYTTIGQTAPRSNQFDRVSYTYIDAAPLAGTNFYRIRAIELTGKNVYSKSLRVDIGRSPKGISLYPNPVKGSEITIGFSASKGQYSLNVVNTAGQVVFKQQVNHAGGTVAQTVALPSSLKSGVYNLLISGDNYKETKMFVIQ